MKVKDVTNYLESIAPLQLQESYDNSGWQVGDHNSELKGVLISLDVTEQVVQEAIDKKCNLIVAHHPLIFEGLKKITSNFFTGNIIQKAIEATRGVVQDVNEIDLPWSPVSGSNSGSIVP